MYVVMVPCLILTHAQTSTDVYDVEVSHLRLI
jgi:hypothetical protein